MDTMVANNTSLVDDTSVAEDTLNDTNEGTFLEDAWALHFHDPDDTQWTPASYKFLGNISTVNDWIQADLAFTNLWSKGMFFLMREHIQPLWEDPYNKKGGCFSFKVNKPDVANVWFKLCSLSLGNCLAKSDDKSLQDNICGVSVSPKRSYCILRIWIGNTEYSNPSMYNIDSPEYTHVLFKAHEDNNDFSVDETKTI